MFDREAYEKRVKWYQESRFGMFIHWGIYAIPARGEWVRSYEEMPEEEYLPFFEEFDPVDYDPKVWAKAAKDAGMKYAILTAKHHDGFCLFDSALTDFKSTNTKLGRDIVRDFLEAFRAEGLKVGLYYSLLDWHHPDYPAYGDERHPMRNCGALKEKKRRKILIAIWNICMDRCGSFVPIMGRSTLCGLIFPMRTCEGRLGEPLNWYGW